MSFFQALMFGDMFITGTSLLALLMAVILIESDNRWWTGGVTIVYMASIQFFTEFDVFWWMWDNPKTTITIVLSSLLIGSVWSVIKWLSISWKVADELKRCTAELGHPPSLEQANEALGERFGWGTFQANRLRARHHKERIVNWIVFWPFSAIGTFFSDPLLRAGDLLYRALSGLYDNITKRLMARAGVSFEQD